MSSYWFDMKLAMRSLARSPGYALVALMMFAFGIGLATFMFGAVKGYLLGALPFPESERIVHVGVGDDTGWSGLPPRVFDEWTRSQSSFSALGGFSIGTVNLSGDDRPERYSGAFVTGALFEALGVVPIAGRTLTADDSRYGAPLVVVIGADLWRNRFNEAPDIVGRVVRVNGRDTEVVGVMPAGFRFPDDESIWVPQQQDLAALPLDGGFDVTVVGRLRDGIGPARALGELQAAHSGLLADAPGATIESAVYMRSLYDAYITDEPRTIILTLFASVVLVLLIACSNVANLTFARISARRRELAVRASLGAGRGRLVGGVVTEVLLLALAGGFLGVLIGEWAGAWVDGLLAASQERPPYWVDSSIDWRTIAFTIAAVFVSALVAGVMPAWRATRGDLNRGLRDGGHGTSDARLGRLSRTLVVVQIVLCCVLLVNAGLMLRSAMNLNSVDDGLGEHALITGRFGLFEANHPDAAARLRTFERLEAALAGLPGVRHATLTTALPLTDTGSVRYRRAEVAVETPADAPSARRTAVTPGYFDAFGIRIVRGRGFTAADRADAAPVAVVNAAFAAREWPQQDPIGRQVQLELPDGPLVTIVGVVADFAQRGSDLQYGARPGLFVPLSQLDVRFVSFAAAVDGEPAAYANAVRDAMLEVDADTPIYWLRTFAEVTALVTFMNRFLASLFGVFAMVALGLAASGVYAVLATAVAARTREIGIRRALGAQDRAIVRMVVGEGGRQYLVGIGVGIALAILFAQALAHTLIGVATFDPLTLAVVAGVLGAAAGLASWVPAKRALRVQPMVALRQD